MSSIEYNFFANLGGESPNLECYPNLYYYYYYK